MPEGSEKVQTMSDKKAIYKVFIHNKFEKSLKGQACFVLVHSSASNDKNCEMLTLHFCDNMNTNRDKMNTICKC